MSSNDIPMIERMYIDFNARNIDGVLAVLADDVAWANGMDGGHVHGREAVREYWTRQWSMVSPHVEPVGFKPEDSEVAVEVVQTIRDLSGQPLEGQDHGLKDKTVIHVFHLAGGKINRFDIREA
ncbi:MAG: nuclear transport factor 2 family protein [Luteibacter sp.]